MKGLVAWAFTMIGCFAALRILETLQMPDNYDTAPLPEPVSKSLNRFDGKPLHLISLGCRPCGFLVFTALSRASQAITCPACGRDDLEYQSKLMIEKVTIEEGKMKAKTGTLTVS